MIEQPPSYKGTEADALMLLLDPRCKKTIDRINDSYFYFDKAKYYIPQGIDPALFWEAVRLSRRDCRVSFGSHAFNYKITNGMQKFLHEADLEFAGSFMFSSEAIKKNSRYYMLSSLMEEAIASSQMEGAATTRKVAKEMLRKQSKPRDKDQQMISNNYSTICFIRERKDEPLSRELILDIHRRIVENTLDSPLLEGSFRSDDEIVVMDTITSEVSHTPPHHEEIEPFIEDLCRFANTDEVYIHPIVKAIMIHFMISFLHPFVDGNGRTARSLFYWYMLKSGYFLTEYMAVSRIIYRSKKQYEKAFLCTEQDGFDLGYFINYNLNVLDKAFNELKTYLDRKFRENQAVTELTAEGGFNVRQAKVIKKIMQDPLVVFTCRDLEAELDASTKTIRSDLAVLVEKGILKEIPINQRLKGYAKGNDFEKLREI